MGDSVEMLLVTGLVLGGLVLAVRQQIQRRDALHRAQVDAQIKRPRKLEGAETYDPAIAETALQRRRKTDAMLRRSMRRQRVAAKPAKKENRLRLTEKANSIPHVVPNKKAVNS